MIELKLTIEEADLIIKALLELPAKQSILLINKLQADCGKQINKIKQ